MKTVIKYELTISKAMRSALSYGTPDEQIDEFIRYLGRHIGADRIYIVSWLSNSDIRMKSSFFLAWIIRLILTVLVLHCLWI